MSKKLITFEGIKLFLYICRHNLLLTFSLTVISIYILLALVGPYFFPLDLIGRNPPCLPPSLQFPLGTDHVGRDVLTQLIHGSRDVLTLAGIGAFFAILLATTAGSVAGLIGGKIDTVVTTIMDVVLTIPSFPLQIVVAATVRGTANPMILGLVIAFSLWAAPGRSIRSQVMSLKNRDFVEASRCIGLNSLKILFFDILPLISPYIIVNGLLALVSAMYSTVGLALVGAIPWSEVNWGVMINTAANYSPALINFDAIWYLLGPLFAIIIFQLAIVGLSNSVEVFFNPRLKEKALTR